MPASLEKDEPKFKEKEVQKDREPGASKRRIEEEHNREAEEEIVKHAEENKQKQEDEKIKEKLMEEEQNKKKEEAEKIKKQLMEEEQNKQKQEDEKIKEKLMEEEQNKKKEEAEKIKKKLMEEEQNKQKKEDEKVKEKPMGKSGVMGDDSDSQSSDSNRIVNRHRNIITTEDKPHSCPEITFIVLSWILMIITFPLSIFLCIIILQEYQRAVILRMGRLRPGGPRGPGITFVLPCIDNYARVDLRTTSLDVPPQDILTQDSVTVNVDAVVYYRITNPLDMILQVMSPRACVRLLCMTTLRNITGSYMLIDLISSKTALSRQIKGVLDNTGATEPWGIRIERVEITDIVMPESLQRAMAVEQEARREAMAKVAAANGERDAVKALKQAADIMESNPIALQLRYLQTLNSICNEGTRAVVFPFPVDLVQKLIK